MTKTKEEIENIHNQAKELSAKLGELSEEELKYVASGVDELSGIQDFWKKMGKAINDLLKK